MTLPSDSNDRWLVLEATQTGAPLLVANHEEPVASINGLFVLRVGPAPVVTLEVTRGQVVILSARLIDQN